MNDASLQGDHPHVLLDGELRSATIALDDDGRVLSIKDQGPAPDPVSGEPLTVVCPAPVDIHMHGMQGVSVPPAGDAAELDAAMRGTGWVATLPIPGTAADACVDHIAAAAEATRGVDGCRGLRIEGMFISPDARGVWPASSLAPLDVGLLDELVAAASGALRIIDVAPELDGADVFIARAREHGLVISLAHSTADHDTAVRAIDAGATLATHVFNAMPPMHHRSPGLAGAVLADDRVTCELIADGVHVHPAVMQTVLRAKPAGRVAFISDASPLAGMPDGDHTWGGMQISKRGHRLTGPTGALAGSALRLEDVPDVMQFSQTCVNPKNILIALTSAPAVALGDKSLQGVEIGDAICRQTVGVVSGYP